MRLALRISSLVSLLALTACASSGELYSKVGSALPKQNPSLARVFVYRDGSMFGAAVQPSVYLDHKQEIWAGVPGSFAYADIQPGSHVLSAETETEKTVNIEPAAGQEVYVKASPAIGFLVGRVELEQVAPDQGKRDMQELHYQPVTAGK